MRIRTYDELIRYKTFDERFDYLKLNGRVSDITFGVDRYLNQIFYTSDEWIRLRNEIIVRDNGCDLGVEGYDIHKHIIIHHLNPITIDDIKNRSEFLLNPKYLISTCLRTHNAIHYCDKSPNIIIERKQGDTRLW